ncbi:MAG: ArsR family transcriptional regulator [Thaumarchaeota archaeon]|nr:ArsR family transcriptional regulator [Nitrososphaerota archaeon]
MKYISYQHNPRVSNLLHIISKSPGLTFTDVMRYSGLANGVLSHYLVNMEKRSMVRSRKGKKMTWYFLPHDPIEEDFIIISLRKETSKNILTFLLTKKQSTFVEITKAAKKSPPVVSITLSQLQDLGLVKATNGFVKKYELTNPDIMMRIIEKIDPTVFEKIKDRFADTFSYF